MVLSAGSCRMPKMSVAGAIARMISSPQVPMRPFAANPRYDSSKSWTRAFARAIAPRRHLCVLPTRTRPSLFGSD